MKRASGISWAGIYVGPIAWAVSTQTNYALAGAQCIFGLYPVPWIALALALLALGGAVLSYSALRTVGHDPDEAERKPRTEHFLAMTGTGMGVLFALGILLQAYAGVIFTGCER